MPWTTITTRVTGTTITAVMWNEIVDNLNFLKEVAYQEFIADASVTATTEVTASDIVSSGAITYEAVPHMIEFFASRVSAGAGGITLVLKDGATVVGYIGSLSASIGVPMLVRRRLTPTAASHTYKVAAFVASGTTTVRAGTGGSDDLPGYIRITRIPT